jgi:ActR/RegA family two-component response regulator
MLSDCLEVAMPQSRQNEPKHSVLIVDDDANFLDAARRALLANGIGDVAPLQDSSRVLGASVRRSATPSSSIQRCIH